MIFRLLLYLAAYCFRKSSTKSFIKRYIFFLFYIFFYLGDEKKKLTEIKQNLALLDPLNDILNIYEKKNKKNEIII